MISQFYKFKDKINLSWDIDNIVSNITTTSSNSVDSYEVLVTETRDPYWQLYKATNTVFSRNFSIAFPSLAKEVVEQLEVLQSQVKPEDFEDLEIYNIFVNHKFDTKRVTLLKSLPGVDVTPHIDNGRLLAINIGLKNSNTCTTYVSNTRSKNEFWKKDLKSYTMEDNDVYILNVDLAHAVKSHVAPDSGRIRYLITYMLVPGKL